MLPWMGSLSEAEGTLEMLVLEGMHSKFAAEPGGVWC